MEQEMRIAAEIQQALLPKAGRSGAYFRAAAASLPCRSIGGDFYDYVDLSDGSFGFALGDVAGKGPPAALLSAMMQGMFAAQAAGSDSPSRTIRKVNLALYRRGIESRFVTLMYGSLVAERPAAVLQRRAQPAARRRQERVPPPRVRRADRRAVRERDLRRGNGHAGARRLADRLQRRRVGGACRPAGEEYGEGRILDGRPAQPSARAAAAARGAVQRRPRVRQGRRAERRHHRDGAALRDHDRARTAGTDRRLPLARRRGRRLERPLRPAARAQHSDLPVQAGAAPGRPRTVARPDDGDGRRRPRCGLGVDALGRHPAPRRHGHDPPHVEPSVRHAPPDLRLERDWRPQACDRAPRRRDAARRAAVAVGADADHRGEAADPAPHRRAGHRHGGHRPARRRAARRPRRRAAGARDRRPAAGRGGQLRGADARRRHQADRRDLAAGRHSDRVLHVHRLEPAAAVRRGLGTRPAAQADRRGDHASRCAKACR